MKGNIKQYSFSNKIYMFFCVLRTRLFYPGVKVIRFPFDIRYGRNIKLGKGVSIGRICRFEVAEEAATHGKIGIEIGENTRINDFVHIAALAPVKMGRDGAIGSRSFITSLNHGDFTEGVEFDITISHRDRALSSKPVTIGDNVWIGESVCILPGVTIGDGCIIGSLSNVVKSIPPYSIAVGNPARVVKQYNFETKCWERVKK